MCHMIGSRKWSCWVDVLITFALKTPRKYFWLHLVCRGTKLSSMYCNSEEMVWVTIVCVCEMRNSCDTLHLNHINSFLVSVKDFFHFINFIYRTNVLFTSVPKYDQNIILFLVVHVYGAFPATTIIFSRSTFHATIGSHTNNDFIIV